MKLLITRRVGFNYFFDYICNKVEYTEKFGLN